MEVKKAILPVEFVTSNEGKATVAKILVPSRNGSRISTHVSEVGEDSVFLERPEEGHLILQEFLVDEDTKIYLELDSRGHLLAILPEGFDAEIDSNGHLILKQTVNLDTNDDFNDDMG